MKKASALAAVFLLTAMSVAAEKDPTINYFPSGCMKAGEMPVMVMNVTGNGELRGYFRRVNTADWCSVIGENRGALSTVTLPKFDEGQEIEYFFLLLDGRRVMARSPRIYRAKAEDSCETPIARRPLLLTMDCTTNGVGSMPAAMGAGFALSEKTEDPISRDTPAN
jgi:hypothetical protein